MSREFDALHPSAHHGAANLPSAHHGAANLPSAQHGAVVNSSAQHGAAIKIVAISGSPSSNSRSKILLEHTLIQLAVLALSEVHLADARLGDSHLGSARGYTDVQLLDLSLLSADALLGRRKDETLEEALCQVKEADILLIGTPVYQGTYTGLLKVFFDLFPKGALRGKAVGLVATGGSSLHALAIDHGLRPLVAALGGVSAAQSLYVTDKLFPDKTQVPSEVSDLASELAHELANLAQRHSALSRIAGQAHPITTIWRNGA